MEQKKVNLDIENAKKKSPAEKKIRNIKYAAMRNFMNNGGKIEDYVPVASANEKLIELDVQQERQL